MANIIVTSTADSGAGSLRAAIAGASSGDVITFDPVVFPVGSSTSILLSSTVNIGTTLEIDAGETQTPRRVVLDGQGSVRVLQISASGSATIRGISIKNGSATTAPGVYILSTGTNSFTDCDVESCVAGATGSGAVFVTAAGTNSFADCNFSGNTAYAGGAFRANTAASNNSFLRCVFSTNEATANGGAVALQNASDNSFTSCEFKNNEAGTNGGAAYGTDSSVVSFSSCEFSGNVATSGSDVSLASTASASFENCDASTGSVVAASTSTIEVVGEITTIGTLTLGTASLTIADGAALTITTSATISATTISSDGRGYLATASGIDISAATLSGVVACSYGAGIESFEISASGATWTADDDSIPILLERESGGSWTTIADDATGGSYSTTFALGETARAFDGVRFWLASTSAYWRVDASFGSADGGGGAGDDELRWIVSDATITPNLEEV